MKTQSINHLIRIVLFSILTVGCSRQSEIQTSISPTAAIEIISPTASHIVETSSTLAPGPTQSLTPVFTVEPSSTPKPSQSPIQPLSCSDKIDTLSNDFSIEGTLLYKPYNHDGLYLVTGMPLLYTPLPETENHDSVVIGFSPDGQRVAYAPITQPNYINWERVSENIQYFETPTLVLVSASGESMEYVLETGDLEFGQGFNIWTSNLLERIVRYPRSNWINNQVIQIRLLFRDLNDPYGFEGFSAPVLFDTEIKGWTTDPFERLGDRYPNGQIGFSPDMERVLYDRKIGNRPYEVVLWDLEKRTEIWSDVDFDYYNDSYLRWAPDSTFVVVSPISISSDSTNILVISHDGEETFNLGDVLKESISKRTFITDIQWSPDSNKIAMLMRDDNRFIYLFDIQQGLVIERCQIPGNSEGSSNIIWSPDSNYMALTDLEWYLAPNPVLLFDVMTGKFFEFMTEGFIYGWSGNSFIPGP